MNEIEAVFITYFRYNYINLLNLFPGNRGINHCPEPETDGHRLVLLE